MCKVVAYMRISTKEERGKQKFTRQEQAIVRWCKENSIEMMQVENHLNVQHGKNWNRIYKRAILFYLRMCTVLPENEIMDIKSTWNCLIRE